MRARPTVFAAVVLLAAGSSLSYAAEPKFQRSLTTNGSVALDVCASAGYIAITGAAGNKVEISGKVHSGNWHVFGNSEDMKKIAEQPPIQQTGNAIHIGNRDTCGGHVFQNIAIDYEITVPKDTAVVATNGPGDIRVQGIDGSLRGETGSGGIRANGIGSNSRLESGSGTIDVQNAHGILNVQTGSGDISVRDSQLSDAKLQAGTGSITTTGVRGGLRIETGSGNLVAGGTPVSDWKLGTGSGSIQLHPDSSAKFMLDAESGSGNIASRITVADSGHPVHGVLRGSVNGGGPLVKMYTGSGNITIE